jgi:hypothetical protein
MNILFVMEPRNNAGNTHALANYMRVGDQMGHHIALLGAPQAGMRGVRLTEEIRGFDHVIYLFESKIFQPKPLQELALLAAVPRRNRFILDADGKFNPTIIIDGYDRNYLNEDERRRWLDFYDTISDRIIKPTLSPSDHPRVITLPFFGYNPDIVIKPEDVPPKRYDVMHLGHNWWRWKQVSQELLPAFQEIRPLVGEIVFLGLWWDKAPDWAPSEGLEDAMRVESDAFRRLEIRAEPPVQFHEVIRTMSMARVNIFTQRPFLAHAKHLTLRYFEEFCADTIPLLMLEDDLAEAVYGPAGHELTLPGRVAEKIMDALNRPDHYRGLVEDVRRHLLAHHPYRKRVDELVAALSD